MEGFWKESEKNDIKELKQQLCTGKEHKEK